MEVTQANEATEAQAKLIEAEARLLEAQNEQSRLARERDALVDEVREIRRMEEYQSK